MCRVKDPLIWQDMAGDTELEKKINSCLTSQFIVSEDVPNDECLREARLIIKIVKEAALQEMLKTNQTRFLGRSRIFRITQKLSTIWRYTGEDQHFFQLLSTLGFTQVQITQAQIFMEDTALEDILDKKIADINKQGDL